MRSISFDVVRPLLGSTVRPNLRSTTSPILSKIRRNKRSGSTSWRRFLAATSSPDFRVGSLGSLMKYPYEIIRGEFYLAPQSLKLSGQYRERPVVCQTLN